MRKEVLVVDYGSQYNQLVARRVRDLGVYSEICSFRDVDEKLSRGDVIGVILTGGPQSAYGKDAFPLPQSILDSKIPVLGICYGFQLISYALGGKVAPLSQSEFGNAEVEVLSQSSPLLKGIPMRFCSFMSHNDSVVKLAPGFRRLGKTASCPNAIASDEERKLYGVQFHPEVNDTQYGEKIFENFLFRIVEAKRDWSMEDFAKEKVESLRREIGPEGRVLLGLSGGVDSSAVAALLSKAIGKRLVCVFVDHGLLRAQEAQEVRKTFSKFDLDFRYVDASKAFFSALKGVVDPEKKRKVIGKLFAQVFQREAEKVKGVAFLAQGTIYPDVVESGLGGHSAKIKSHHNVGGLPKKLGFKGLVEPLRFLFKDEVRKVGRTLGLPPSLVDRQPFPGPGLGIRILGEVTPQKVKIVQRADAILREEVEKAGLEGKIGQWYAALTDAKTVGVEGDGRTYERAVAIRAVKTVDFMTATPYPFPYEVLFRVADRIVDEVEGVNRVFYDCTSKPPATIELE